MKKHKKWWLAMSWLVVALPATASYTGRVYGDTNQNGRFDEGEKPLKNVKVSDGLHVVATDAEGHFSLPGHPRERFIFITTPSGYKTFNQHYLPIQTATTSYDFGLIPYEAGISSQGTHRFIQVTDSEIFNTSNNEAWVDDIRKYAHNEQVAFVVHTGDICYEKGLQEHIQLMNTANMDVPVYYCIGNHDLVKGKYGEELFEKYYGPVYYSFDVAGVHYVVTPMPGGDHRPGYTRDDVCRWLKNDLAQVKPGTPLYIFNHDVLTTENRFIYRGQTDSLDLETHDLKAWIYGHWHINLMKKQGNVWTVSTSSPDKGGIDHSKAAFRVFEVDKQGQFTSDLRYAYLKNHLKIASPQGMTPSRTLTVNTYASVSPVSRVTYTCRQGNKVLWKNRPMIQQTDWSWTAELPLKERHAGMKLTLEVVAEQRNGQRVVEKQTFTYQSTPMDIHFGTNWDNLLGNAAHSKGVTTAKLDSTLGLAWIKNVGANLYMTSPLIHDEIIYVASVDENAQGKAGVYALDGKTGELLWKYTTAASIKNTIAYESGRVFAQDVWGNLYAIDGRTGMLAWQAQLPVKGLPALIDGLATADGKVYAGSGLGLSAFDATTGKLLWRNQSWQQGEGTTTTLSVGEDFLLGSVQWSALYANDRKTGKLLWSASHHGLRHRASSVAIHGELLYVISDHSFFILEASTGRIIVRKKLKEGVDVTSTPLLTDREIIFGTATSGLMALDNETLEERWNCPVGDALIYTSPYTRPVSGTIETSPIQAGELIFVAASDGNLYGIDRKNGQVKWQYATGAPIFGSVAASGNSLVSTDFGGNVYLFAPISQP